MNQAEDEKMVPNLIIYRNKIINIVKQCFNNHSLFTGAISLAFEFFINKRENKPAEMMGLSLLLFDTSRASILIGCHDSQILGFKVTNWK